jgi:enamine deaminase RidA (YjgF/YER057c/UK114 family)
MIIEKKLDALGLTLFDVDRQYRANASGARFMSHLTVNNVLYLSGTTPVKDGAPHLTGVVGAELSIEQGYEAARYALLSSLAVVKYALGDLDRVQQAVQLLGFVNSAPGFAQQPRVINGATDLLVELYGDRGKPTRAAIGCQGLALNHSVEVVLTVLFSGDGVTPPLARDHYVK